MNMIEEIMSLAADVTSISTYNLKLLREQLQKMKPRMPVGVSVLITNHQNHVLMGRRKNNSGAGLLSTPGGRLEETENILGCAVREVQEEVGVRIGAKELTILGFMEHFRFGNHYVMFYVHAPRYYGEIKNVEPEKCEEWLWTDIKNLLDAPLNTTEPVDILLLLKKRLEAAQ